jgi:hypothetical protein
VMNANARLIVAIAVVLRRITGLIYTTFRRLSRGGGRDRRVARQIEPFRDYERRECLKHALHRRGHHFEVQLGSHSGCVRSRSQRLTVCWRRNSGRRARVSIVIALV